MSTDDPGNALRNTVVPDAAGAPERWVEAPSLRTRTAGILLVIACLVAPIGAVLPWLTAVNVSLASGLSTRLFTWHVWSIGCGVLFPLFVIPLFLLARTGLRAIRGLPLPLKRRSAVLVALAGGAGIVTFGIFMAIASGLATFNPYWGRCCRTDFMIESGFYVSLAGYGLAIVASLLLPAGSGA